MIVNEISDDSHVGDFAVILESQTRNHERLRNYADASIAKKKLTELRKHQENLSRETLRVKQIEEKLGIEECHMIELQRFNQEWDNKFADFQRHADAQIEMTQNRHDNYNASSQCRLCIEFSKPKFSKELLNLRRIQEALAKQQNYEEANKMKKKADTLEAIETQQWLDSAKTNVRIKDNKLNTSKSNEISVLQQRIQLGRNELNIQRQKELERLLLLYQNVKQELDAEHALERARLGRKFVRHANDGKHN